MERIYDELMLGQFAGVRPKMEAYFAKGRLQDESLSASR